MSDQFKDKVSRTIFTAYRDFYVAVNKINDENGSRNFYTEVWPVLKRTKDSLEAAASEAILEGLNDPEKEK